MALFSGFPLTLLICAWIDFPSGLKAADASVETIPTDCPPLVEAVRMTAPEPSSTNPEPSHVLLAMGLDEDTARASLRFGLGLFTTAEEINFAIDAVAQAVSRLRRSRVAWTARDGA